MNDAPFSHALAKQSQGDYLSHEAVLALVAKYQATGCAASLNRILLNFSDMCMQIANRYRVKFEIEDTYQDAMEFLILALRKFNPEFGVPFYAYASPRVKHEVSQRAIRKWASVTTPGSKGFFKAFRAMGRFRDERMTHEHANALSAELDVPIDCVYAAHAIYKDSSYSLDSSLIEDGAPMIESLTDNVGPEQIVMESDLHQKQAAIAQRRMESLNPNELRVIQNRRLREEPKKLFELGSELGISGERVRQIEAKAMLKLCAAA